ncbi:hypothetical protein [Streptomyces sp. NBC_00829]|uniref:hypothetical protein n=1 Tax=Streptomyces sp. NBC_00829 TaxID=2903679 RepID=UPI003870D351|nr:hypothetical protein OG293_40385 [Streptomyces sp. NBC_00829]WTB19958.1 hypothetical protein OG293_41620 [Streptomyces sp. NBC_00829]
MTIDEIAQHRTVVLEGGDGVGKTTLADLLVTQSGFIAVHSPRTPDHQNLTRRYRDLLARPGRLVLDRSFVSELVYGPLYRDRSRITWDEALGLAGLVTARDGVFLHLTAPAAVVRSRLMARDGQAPELEEIAALGDAYERVFRVLTGHVSAFMYAAEPESHRPTG